MSNDAQKSNVPEFSVSDLAFSLKRTLEENYGRVRVRGELSRLTIAGSGHMYSSLKDENAVIDAVCWKGNVSRLSVKPEEGLEVICTGKISSYPKSSKYQLVIETMELAGEGALLKMLEERRKKLAGEGLFAIERKKPLPFLPQTIGVVTSPTGAVIRDILHRLADRMPSHVLVWPVLVQGEGAADQITKAIEGFDKLPKTPSPLEGGGREGGETYPSPDTQIPKPDLLIVARGGGSLEDLMAFNEENVVRAAANCSIPIISAVGHETDTTLIDYAADLRAPTPTGAAEKAVPVRAELLAQILEGEQRLINATNRLMNDCRTRLENQSRGLGDPKKLLEIKTQNLDHATEKLTATFRHYLAGKRETLITQSAGLRHPKAIIDDRTKALARWSEQLFLAAKNITKEHDSKIDHLGKMLKAYSFQNTLERGFAVVRTQEGIPVTTGPDARTHAELSIQFKNDEHVQVYTSADEKPPKKIKKTKPTKTDQGQQSLF